MNQLINKYTILLLTIVITGMLSCTDKTQYPTAQKGVMNIENWDFSKNKPLNLDGEWEFYNEKLLNPSDFADTLNKPKMTGYFKMPNVWLNYKDSALNLKSFGYCTYRLIIKTDSPGQLVVINLKEILTAYKLYVNGVLIASNGEVGTTSEISKPAFIPTIAGAVLNKTENEIILQNSNFHHRLGGVFNKIQIGDDHKIITNKIIRSGYDMFLFGALIIMSFYHFALFLLRKKDKSNLFFAIYSLMMAIRSITTGEELIAEILPSLSWEWSYKTEYLTFFMSAPAFLAFFYKIFPKNVRIQAVYFLTVISGLFLIIVLFRPASFYSKILVYYQFIILALIFYTTWCIINAIRLKQEGGKTILLGSVIFFAAAVNDILYSQGVIYSTDATPLGLFVFIFCQSFIISRKFSNAFNRTEELTIELNYQKDNLEQIVKNRTQELQLQKEEIMVINEALQQHREEIMATNEQLEFQKSEIEKQNDEISRSNNKLIELNQHLQYQTKALDETSSVVITNPQGEILYVNNKLCEISQYSRTELIGKSSNILKSNMHPPAYYQQMWKRIREEKGIWRGEICNKKKNGEFYWEEATIVPYLNEKGDVYQYLAIRNDITEKKQAAIRIGEQNIELTQQKHAIEAIHKDLTDSITYAKHIQQSAFRVSEKIIEEQFKHFILYKPKNIVSGDFYWARKYDNIIYLAAADCTGHGVPGAFMSLLSIVFLSEITRHGKDLTPDKILIDLRKSIISFLGQTAEIGKQKDGLDISLCMYNTETGIIQFAGAYNSLIILRNGILHEYKADKMTVGISFRNTVPFTNHIIETQKNDIIYMFSDGYKDQFGGEKNIKFSSRRFKELLKEIAVFEITEQKEKLEEHYKNWKQTQKQIDDILVIGIKL